MPLERPMGALPGSLVVGGAKGSMVGGCAPGAWRKAACRLASVDPQVWRGLASSSSQFLVLAASMEIRRHRPVRVSAGPFAFRPLCLAAEFRSTAATLHRHFSPAADHCLRGKRRTGQRCHCCGVYPGCYRCTVAVGARNRVGCPNHRQTQRPLRVSNHPDSRIRTFRQFA